MSNLVVCLNCQIMVFSLVVAALGSEGLDVVGTREGGWRVRPPFVSDSDLADYAAQIPPEATKLVW